MSEEVILSVKFEVFGKVQKVYFRKYTANKATQLGLKGYCMNTVQKTVQGVMEGPPAKVHEMKTWLQKVGSPASRIDRAVFTEERTVPKYSYNTFFIKK